MIEIIKQEECTQEGNDCLIKDCYVILKCHGKYIVMNICRYIGWCDHGMDFRGRREFKEDEIENAEKYFYGELRTM
jgi:hypothetical protein